MASLHGPLQHAVSRLLSGVSPRGYCRSVTYGREAEAVEQPEAQAARAETEPGSAAAPARVAPALSRATVMRLQRSSGNAAVSALISGSRTLQRVALKSFADGTPEHDPSRLSDSDIQGTDEYKAYMAMNPVPVPMRDVTPDEAKLACQLLLRAMRQSPTPIATGPDVLDHWLNVARTRSDVAAKAEATVGQETWVQVTPDNVNDPAHADSDFIRWMLAGGNQPDAKTGKLNCWEMVLFSAYRDGAVSEKQMRDIYTAAKDAMTKSGDVMEFPRTIERLLRSSAEQIYDPKDPNSPRPLRGDIVIFKEAAGHVALATGQRTGAGVEVVSHWPPPDGSYHVKRTTIEALMATLKLPTAKFWSPMW